MRIARRTFTALGPVAALGLLAACGNDEGGSGGTNNGGGGGGDRRQTRGGGGDRQAGNVGFGEGWGIGGEHLGEELLLSL